MIDAGKTDRRLGEKKEAPVTFGAFTSVLVRAIGALSAVLARCAGTLVNVDLTKVA